MSCYFTADTHFGSERTWKYSRRPFDSIEEMDNVLIRNWNETVKTGDTVYHLGDFGDYKTSRKLNGKIVLFCGNYEMDYLGISIDDLNKSLLSFNPGDINLMSAGCRKLEAEFNFEKVYYNSGKTMIFLDYNCTHRPQDCIKTEFNLFGHIHGLCKVKRYGLNVGVDCNGFKPVSVSEVEFYRFAIGNVFDENLFE